MYHGSARQRTPYRANNARVAPARGCGPTLLGSSVAHIPRQPEALEIQIVFGICDVGARCSLFLREADSTVENGKGVCLEERFHANRYRVSI